MNLQRRGLREGIQFVLVPKVVRRSNFPYDFGSDLSYIINRFHLQGYRTHSCYFDHAAVQRSEKDAEVYSVTWNSDVSARRFRMVVDNDDTFPYRIVTHVEVPEINII